MYFYIVWKRSYNILYNLQFVFSKLVPIMMYNFTMLLAS